MTLAVSLKINDGLVLASDSAATLGSSQGITHVYNNANKILNLHKGLPIGVATWGKASIGSYSIELILKDLRKKLCKELDFNSYSIKDVADRLKKYVFDENYKKVPGHESNQHGIGFFVCGYGAGENKPEEYLIEITGGQCNEPELIRDTEKIGITWRGEGEALNRLLMGYRTDMPYMLKRSFELDEEKIENLMKQIRPGAHDALITPAMPLQDAIDLAKFLVNTARNFSYFSAGAPSVGGPVEVAAITRHEGFKWVDRKHYFSNKLNPDF